PSRAAMDKADRGLDRITAACNDDVDFQADELGRQLTEPLVLSSRRLSLLDEDTFSLHVSQLLQALSEGREETLLQSDRAPRQRPGPRVSGGPRLDGSGGAKRARVPAMNARLSITRLAHPPAPVPRAGPSGRALSRP